MIEFNLTLIVQMVNFFVFLLIMRAIFFKPLIKAIEERRNYIAESERKIADGLAKLEEAQKKHQADLDEARKHAQDTVNSSIAAAEEEKSKIVQATQEETRKAFEEFKKELGDETAKAKEQLITEVDSLANDIAKKVLA